MTKFHPALKNKVIAYLQDHPNAWTRDVHQAVARGADYRDFYYWMVSIEGITYTKHTNGNLRWSLKQK